VFGLSAQQRLLRDRKFIGMRLAAVEKLVRMDELGCGKTGMFTRDKLELQGELPLLTRARTCSVPSNSAHSTTATTPRSSRRFTPMGVPRERLLTEALCRPATPTLVATSLPTMKSHKSHSSRCAI
jgi:hypothetical protein